MGLFNIDMNLLTEMVSSKIYHFTTAKSLLGIAIDKHMTTSNDDGHNYGNERYISFTRAVNGFLGYSQTGNMVRIEFNGDKINQVVKGKPMSYNSPYYKGQKVIYNTGKPVVDGQVWDDSSAKERGIRRNDAYMEDVENEDRIMLDSEVFPVDENDSIFNYIVSIDIWLRKNDNDIYPQLIEALDQNFDLNRVRWYLDRYAFLNQSKNRYDFKKVSDERKDSYLIVHSYEELKEKWQTAMEDWQEYRDSFDEKRLDYDRHNKRNKTELQRIKRMMGLESN